MILGLLALAVVTHTENVLSKVAEVQPLLGEGSEVAALSPGDEQVDLISEDESRGLAAANDEFYPNRDYSNKKKKEAAYAKILSMVTPWHTANLKKSEVVPEHKEKLKAKKVAKKLTERGDISQVDITAKTYFDYDLNQHAFPDVFEEVGSPAFKKIHGQNSGSYYKGPAPLRL